MVVRKVHQYSDLGLKIRRVPVQNMILLLHVDASLNTGGLVGSQGGFICGVTDQSLQDGTSAPWSPLAWRYFKMNRTTPSSLGAEAQAMSVALGFVEWATLFFAGADSRFVRFVWCSSGDARETCTIICWQLGAQQRCKTRSLPSMCSLFESL